MANNSSNTINIGGNYTGTVTVSGPVILGRNITVERNDISAMITGNGTSASQDAQYSFVGGQYAKSDSSLTFVWNGSDFENGDQNSETQYSSLNLYQGANREGTFSINPNGNLGGFFIGSKSLHSHMDELSGHVVESFSLTSVNHSSEIDNNIVHKEGFETISGAKTFTSSITIGSSESSKVVIDNSSIRINSNNNGGLIFHFNGSSNPTASIKETTSGTLTLGSGINVSGNSTFKSNINTFNGITLNSGCNASFKDGNVYVATSSARSGSSLVASTEYVDNAITQIESVSLEGDNTFTGKTTFSNDVSISPSVTADFKQGNLYVSDRTMTEQSSLAVNIKYVRDFVSSLRGNKTSIGSSLVPIYLTGTSYLDASLVQSVANVGTNKQPIFMDKGSLKGSSVTVGGLNKPVYLSNGVITECSSIVNSENEQNITGRKIFTSSMNMFRSSPKIYSSVRKGNQESYGSSTYVEFICSTNPSSDTYSEQSMRIGAVGTNIGNDNYTRSFISAYSNVANNSKITSAGVVISSNGNEKYAFAPTPTTINGTMNSTTDTNSSIVPTIGWTNSLFARLSGASFTGSVSAENNILVKSTDSTKGIKIIYGNSIASHIGLDYSGEILEILPCDTYNRYNSQSTASSIRLGYATLGSSIQPIFLDGGRISSITGTVGSSLKPVYLSSGKITETSDVVHIDYTEKINGVKDFGGVLITCKRDAVPTGINPTIYSDYAKGSPMPSGSRVKLGIGFSDSSKEPSDSKMLGKIVHSIDSNGSSISMFAYKNEYNSTLNANIGVFISKNGDRKYAFAPTPPPSISTSEDRIATTGWCNSYFMRKSGEGATFDGNLKCNSSLNVNGAIWITDGVGSSARIIQENGSLKISGNTVDDNSHRIKIGNSTIGSSISPVYLNSGVITECDTSPKVIGRISRMGINGWASLKLSSLFTNGKVPSSIRMLVINSGNTKVASKIGLSISNGSALYGDIDTDPYSVSERMDKYVDGFDNYVITWAQTNYQKLSYEIELLAY